MKVLWCDNLGSCFLVLTDIVVLWPLVIATDNMHTAISTSVAQCLGSLCKAIGNKLMQTASSEELYRELCAGAVEEDEVDHDMRLDDEIP